MNELNRPLISTYAKQLRVPTFNQYEEVIRQLEANKSFDDFLVSLMRAELENRQESNRKRNIHSARFPYTKTLEEFDCSYLENVSEAQIHQLASCDFCGHDWQLRNQKDPSIHCSGAQSLYAGAKCAILHGRQSFQRTDRGPRWSPTAETGKTDSKLRSADYRREELPYL